MIVLWVKGVGQEIEITPGNGSESLGRSLSASTGYYAPPLSITTCQKMHTIFPFLFLYIFLSFTKQYNAQLCYRFHVSALNQTLKQRFFG